MSGSRTHWKKPPTRVYDYNYNLGEHYYKPQLRHADLKSHGRAGSPPKAQTFAERFAASPVYGSYGTPSWTSPGRKTSLTEDLFGRPSRSVNTEKFIPRGDRIGQSEDLEFGEFGKPRFSFGDRLLEAAGGGTKGRTAPLKVDLDNAFDDPIFQRGKKIGRDGNWSADPNFMNEDPFKSRNRRVFDTTSADELMDDMKHEAESAASKFRSKLRMKRGQDDTDFGFGDDDAAGENSTESRIEKIRARAKARIAEAMEDDFLPPTKPAKSFYSDDFDSEPTATAGGGKTVRISKRSLKTTFDMD